MEGNLLFTPSTCDSKMYWVGYSQVDKAVETLTHRNKEDDSDTSTVIAAKHCLCKRFDLGVKEHGHLGTWVYSRLIG